MKSKKKLNLSWTQKLSQQLHPNVWGWKHYAGIFAFFLALNLLGPKGIIHWIIVEQEASRLETRKLALENELVKLKEELKRFETSDIAKIRAIQEDLGYLTDEEVSFEFTDAIESDAPTTRAR